MNLPATVTVSENANARAKRLTGRDYISYSALTTYQQCPLRYYFKYVLGLPEATVFASLVFGGAIHAAVEHHYRELLAGNPAPGLHALLAAYQAAWQERKEQDVRFGKDEDQTSLEGMAERMLTAFHESDLAQPAGTIIGVEEELRGEIVPGLPDLLGRVDLLIDTGPELVVTDLKTSRNRWTADQAENSAEQLLLYGELARRLDPDKTVRLEFAVMTKAKTPAVDRYGVQNSPRRLTRTLSIIRRIWAAIRSLSFYPAPSPMQCPTCPFRKPCRAWTGT